jgi:LexA DNA binding domain
VGNEAKSIRMSVAALSRQLAGRVIAEVTQPTDGSVVLRLTDGAQVVFEQRDGRVKVILHAGGTAAARSAGGARPTGRQLEYLDFITRYIARYGVSPAETDIQRHFMVSAPSVNQMVRTLERRGFIERDHGWYGETVARSIRVIWGA